MAYTFVTLLVEASGDRTDEIDLEAVVKIAEPLGFNMCEPWLLRRSITRELADRAD